MAVLQSESHLDHARHALTVSRQSCIDCKKTYPEERMQEAIRTKVVPHCLDASCNGLVKPEIVFFGEQLPSAFFENRHLPSEADLAIIMGSSLSVHPFASLPQLCEDRTPRLLINMEQVGDLGSRPDDVLMLEDCDTGVRKLAEACGWLEELEALWATTARDGDQSTAPPEEEMKKSRDEILQDEVDKLTKEVEENLKLGEAQHKWLENYMDKKIARGPQDSHNENEGLEVRGTDNAESRTMAPVAKSTSGSALGHVFPFLKKGSL
jgi:NAD-dependent histone deacetylase SIR2